MGLFAEYRPDAPHGARPEGLVVRPATAADLPAVARLRASRDQVSFDESLASFERLLARVNAGEAALLVADLGGVTTAYGCAARFDPPPGAPPDVAPAGWYLMGVVVDPAYRRRGIGALLTRARLDWIARRASEAYYFVSAVNRASIDLHAGHGFVEVTRAFSFPRVSFTGGVGVLFRADLAAASPRP